MSIMVPNLPGSHCIHHSQLLPTLISAALVFSAPLSTSHSARVRSWLTTLLVLPSAHISVVVHIHMYDEEVPLLGHTELQPTNTS